MLWSAVLHSIASANASMGLPKAKSCSFVHDLRARSKAWHQYACTKAHAQAILRRSLLACHATGLYCPIDIGSSNRGLTASVEPHNIAAHSLSTSTCRHLTASAA